MSVHPTKSGKWEARYREGRRNRSKTFDLEEDARAFDGEARARRQRGEHVRRASDTPTLGDFAADWMARRAAAGLAEATLKTNLRIYEKHVDPYLGGRRVADLSPRRLDAWRRELEDAGTSVYLLNRSKALLGQIMADAKRLEYVSITPPAACRPCAAKQGRVRPRRRSRSSSCAPASSRPNSSDTPP